MCSLNFGHNKVNKLATCIRGNEPSCSCWPVLGGHPRRPHSPVSFPRLRRRPRRRAAAAVFLLLISSLALQECPGCWALFSARKL